MNDLWQETVERWARQVEAERRCANTLGTETFKWFLDGYRYVRPSLMREESFEEFTAEAELATAKRDVEALGCKVAALMSDLHSLQAENKRLSDLLAAAEEKGREAVVTDTEQMADQMRQDILGGKIDKVGRKVVRDACDHMDAPPVGRDKQDGALGNISRRGGY